MSTYHKTIVAYCSTIIAALALYYVAFGAMSERLLNELNVKDKFAHLVSDATALIFLTVIACAIGYCCSVITNHLVCVRNNERRIRAGRAEVDAQVSAARLEIEAANAASRNKAVLKSMEQATDVGHEQSTASEPFPNRGSECWTVPHRYLADTGRMTPQQFREQYMCDLPHGGGNQLSYFQIADLVMWWLNLSAGYATRNDVSCAIRGLTAYNMITGEEGRGFISAYRNICSLKPND